MNLRLRINRLVKMASESIIRCQENGKQRAYWKQRLKQILRSDEGKAVLHKLNRIVEQVIFEAKETLSLTEIRQAIIFNQDGRELLVQLSEIANGLDVAQHWHDHSDCTIDLNS